MMGSKASERKRNPNASTKMAWCEETAAFGMPLIANVRVCVSLVPFVTLNAISAHSPCRVFKHSYGGDVDWLSNGSLGSHVFVCDSESAGKLRVS